MAPDLAEFSLLTNNPSPAGRILSILENALHKVKHYSEIPLTLQILPLITDSSNLLGLDLGGKGGGPVTDGQIKSSLITRSR